MIGCNVSLADGCAGVAAGIITARQQISRPRGNPHLRGSNRVEKASGGTLSR